MADDLAELKERVGLLERYVNLLELRVDSQESIMQLNTAGRKRTTPPSSDDGRRTGADEDDPRYKGFDYLLRTILAKQGMHNGDIRTLLRNQEYLGSRMTATTGTLDSIEKILHDVNGQIRTLIQSNEDR
jgi:hypothetical protein